MKKFESLIILLDEAQNTTILQMKMILTRIGSQSRMIINGDTQQIDLTAKNHSGLTDAYKRLAGIDNISMIEFTKTDIVRHPLIEKIIQAYDS